PQRLPVNELHGNEGAIEFADVVNRANSGMVQVGGSVGLTPETFERLWIMRYIVRKELQGDRPVKAYVFGLVNDPHASCPNSLDDPVVRDCLADHVLADYRRHGHRPLRANYSVGSSPRGSVTAFRRSVFGGLGVPSRRRRFVPSP